MNIAEIARLAGVSSAAVSRYFNRGYVSEEKREAIRKVVEETGYRPLPQARMLRTRKTMCIGMIASKIDAPGTGCLIDEALRVLDEAGYWLILSTSGGDRTKENALLTSLDEGQVDGILLLSPYDPANKELTMTTSDLSVPVVVIGEETIRTDPGKAGENGAQSLLAILTGEHTATENC